MKPLPMFLAVAGLSLRLAAECSLIFTAADLSGDLDWPQIAHDAGIDVLATHVGPKDVIPFLQNARGRKFLADCRRYGIGVEHELHALEYLLPRALFESEPELFRMDDKGNRRNDANCCPSHPRALAIIASNAVEVARICRPTTHRYYFWMTDDKPVCFCPECRPLSASDQAVLVENAIVRALRAQLDPEARLSHLAYLDTLEAPRKVRPDPALFLEFAPIRRWDGVTKRKNLAEDGMYAKFLEENLAQFPSKTAKALEYWLDESLFCNWSDDRVEIPWDAPRTREDLEFYRRRGISSFSTFAVKIDDAYVAKYGESFRDHIRSFAALARETVRDRPEGISFGYEGNDRVLKIENRHGRVVLSLKGAQIRSYAPAGVGEVLYRPQDMSFQGTTENRGGIPLCWPWFGRNGEPGSAPHGFARHSDFSVLEFFDDGARTGVVMSLAPTDETRRLFPYDCALEYRVLLGETLQLELKTVNRGTNEVLITEGIHPYWRVEDRRRTSVAGLDGAPYCFADLTTVSNAVWKGDLVPSNHLDHVFWCGGKPLRIADEVSGRTVELSGSGFSKYVVWTPDAFRDGDFENLPSADKMNFVCVEPATLFRTDGYRLPPGKSHVMSVSIRARGRNPTLEAGFRDPPKAASPHVWYHLMNGHVTKEGITRDFEALAAAGIGGVQMFDAGCGIDAGPMAFASDAWFDMMAHAFREAERLGLEVVVANCSGWSTAGGPWIAPSNSMKRLVFAKSDVLAGDSHFSGVLPLPPDTNGFYEDVAVLAVPEPSTRELPRPVRTSEGDVIVLDFGREVVARGFSYRVEMGEPWSLDGEIAAEPGGRYPLTVARSGVTDGAFRYRAFRKPETARRFRFSLELAEPTTAHNPPGTSVRLADVRLEGDVKVDELAAKAFVYRMDVSPTPAESDRPVPVSSVIDLTGRMSADGKLDWSVPPGRWRLLRFGFASNGKKCHPASKAGEGLEVDKLDPEAVALHFAAYVGRLAAIGSPAFKGVLVDSYEAGAQNWTRGLERQFRERKGYDLRPWLPVFAGYVVESVAASERTLTDFRQVVSERFATSFAGTLQRLCHEAGLRLNLEPYGNAGVRNLDYGAFADVPMSEFWLHDDRRFEDGGNGRIAASLAHVLGLPIAAAEAFTSAPGENHGRWLDTPWRMKSAGDRAYAAGVNRIVYHRFTHQPDADDSCLPGMTMGMFGAHFDRKQTWWKGFAKPFVDYQRRCQWMLQAGAPRVDVLFVNGDGVPDEGGSTHGGAPNAYPLPDGYSGDVATESVVRRILRGDDGIWLAPGGARYLAVVPWGASAGEVLREKRIAPDVLAPGGTFWTHRGDGTRDWYFIARENETAEVARCSFRLNGRVPEIWDAETGDVRRALEWREDGARTEVSVRLRPHGSAFVVFGRLRNEVAEEEPLRRSVGVTEVAGAWDLSFLGIGRLTLPGLRDWTTLEDGRMKCFSGTAEYRKTLPAPVPKDGGRLVLELGRVCDFAEVIVNGGAPAVLWRPPYEVDVTEAARKGELSLLIRVTNLWPNRLIGDDALPRSERTTKTSWRHWAGHDALRSSGLLGPVRLTHRL